MNRPALWPWIGIVCFVALVILHTKGHEIPMMPESFKVTPEKEPAAARMTSFERAYRNQAIKKCVGKETSESITDYCSCYVDEGMKHFTVEELDEAKLAVLKFMDESVRPLCLDKVESGN